MCAHVYAAVHDGSAIFLTSRDLLGEDVATTVSSGLATLTASRPFWSVVFLIGSLSNWGEANAAVTSIHEEVAAKKRGHYHHLSASMHAAIGKYASVNGAARHFSSEIAQLVGVFEIIIARILCPYKNSGLIKHFSRWKFPAIRYLCGCLRAKKRFGDIHVEHQLDYN